MSKILPAIIEESHFEEAAAAQSLQNIKDAAERHMRRMAQYTAWVEPEAQKLRYEQFLKDSEAALERGKAMAFHSEEFLHAAFPDPLPKEMRGQSPSTIRIMLKDTHKIVNGTWVLKLS